MFSVGSPMSVKTWLVIALLCLAALMLGYYGGNARIAHSNAHAERLAEQNQSLYQQLDQLEYQRNILQVELDVERAAGRSIQVDLRRALEENANITRELAFYQRVVSPERSANGIGIDSFVIAPTPNENRYYFRLILLQLERAQQRVTGDYKISIRGQQGTESAELNVLKLVENHEQLGAFNMSYFSLHEATFELPADFQPQTVVVTVAAGRGENIEQSFEWRLLLNNAVDAAAELSGTY